MRIRLIGGSIAIALAAFLNGSIAIAIAAALLNGSIAIALAAALLSATPSRAYIPQPWCTDSLEAEAGAPVCMYRSYAQCVENARVGCVANPAIDPLPTVPGSTIFMLAQPMHHNSRHG